MRRLGARRHTNTNTNANTYDIIAITICFRYEPALEGAEAALDMLVTEMIKCMDKPFAFFGRGPGSQVWASLSSPTPFAFRCSSITRVF